MMGILENISRMPGAKYYTKKEDGQATFEYFMECDKEECPFYHHIGPEEDPLFETCMKAKKEMEQK